MISDIDIISKSAMARLFNTGQILALQNKKADGGALDFSDRGKNEEDMSSVRSDSGHASQA